MVGPQESQVLQTGAKVRTGAAQLVQTGAKVRIGAAQLVQTGAKVRTGAAQLVQAGVAVSQPQLRLNRLGKCHSCTTQTRSQRSCTQGLTFGQVWQVVQAGAGAGAQQALRANRPRMCSRRFRPKLSQPQGSLQPVQQPPPQPQLAATTGTAGAGAGAGAGA